MYTPKGELNDNLLKLVQTEGILDKFAEAKDPEKCYEIAKEAGTDVSKEEFMANMSIMKAYMEESGEGILSEDDLDQVAGGKGGKLSKKDIIDISISGVSAAAGVAGAAAAAA